jgi:hypothetical protein
LPQILDFSPVNDDDAGQTPKLIAGFDWPSDPAPALEPGAPPAEFRDENAPRVESPLEDVAPFDDAA